MTAQSIYKSPAGEQAVIEVIARREFVVNLKIARQLGVAIPRDVLKRADRIID